jgi:hypothetical protein
MGATEEQMQLISDAGITHVSYVLVLYSFSFLMFLLTNILLHVYATNSSPPVPPKDVETPERIPRMNGLARSESREIRDVQEFELEGLMSEDESPNSPSTLGKNNEAVVY